MMLKSYKAILVVFIILLLAFLVGIGYFLYYKKTQIKDFLTQDLPQISELGKVNLSGKLFGPLSSNRAIELNPEQIIFWTNRYRQDEGLKPLTNNDLLAKAAQKKTEEMFEKNYFDHVSPTGQTPAELVTSVGYKYKTTGENLALGDFLSEKDLVDAWMASPGHRANILNSDYIEIGVAAGLDNIDNRTTWLAVQEFGTPAPNCPSLNQNLANDINSKKSEYENLSKELTNIADEAKSLANEANSKTQQGNEIYRQTGKASQAQPYWQEGEDLRYQSQQKYQQAQQIQNQMNSLYNKINSLVNQYNAQVNNYNACIR